MSSKTSADITLLVVLLVFMMNCAACSGIYVQQSTDFVSHMAHILVHHPRSVPDQIETKLLSHTMRVRKVSARDMIEEENLKQKTTFTHNQVQPRSPTPTESVVYCQSKRWSQSERSYPGSEPVVAASYRRCNSKTVHIPPIHVIDWITGRSARCRWSGVLCFDLRIFHSQLLLESQLIIVLCEFSRFK